MTVTLRRALATDRDQLLAWVNSPDSLAGKLRTMGPIAAADHAQWFAARLADDDCMIWIIERNDTAVGQIRLEKDDVGHAVDIYVVAAARRHGCAVSALRQALDMHFAGRPDSRVVARIKPDNIASRRLFERAGFQLTADGDDHLIYALRPPKIAGDVP